ncbi:5'-3' exonuclease PLD4 [Lemur catta]|uniref:5'-3' exonuclease PLD4 n=1 Tax=Lemur catta TaxID=9447 RepID=UPI001E26940E|nr:5'-3' exonuclease PLD4 [Lemur catta]
MGHVQGLRVPVLLGVAVLHAWERSMGSGGAGARGLWSQAPPLDPGLGPVAACPGSVPGTKGKWLKGKQLQEVGVGTGRPRLPGELRACSLWLEPGWTPRPHRQRCRNLFRQQQWLPRGPVPAEGLACPTPAAALVLPGRRDSPCLHAAGPRPPQAPGGEALPSCRSWEHWPCCGWVPGPSPTSCGNCPLLVPGARCTLRKCPRGPGRPWGRTGRSPCRLVLVESVPQDLPSAAGSPSAQPLARAWLQLLDAAQDSVHVASYYWSLTGRDIGVNDSSSQPVCPFPRPHPGLTLGHRRSPPCSTPGWAHSKSDTSLGRLRGGAAPPLGLSGRVSGWVLGTQHSDSAWREFRSRPRVILVQIADATLGGGQSTATLRVCCVSSSPSLGPRELRDGAGAAVLQDPDSGAMDSGVVGKPEPQTRMAPVTPGPHALVCPGLGRAQDLCHTL